MMRKKRTDSTNKYEFLNKYELADLAARDVKYRKDRRMPFKCRCGCTEFVDLRDGFGECWECKAPYIVDDDRRSKIYRGVE